MSITTGTINLIKNAFDDLELDLPKPYVKGLADLDAHQARITTLPGRDDAALADAVLAALKAGKEVTESEDVRRELARLQLHSSLIGDIVGRRLDHHRSALLDKHVDAILAVMAATLAGIDATLAEARAVLPADVNLAESSSATRVPPKDLALWGNARATIAKIDRIAQTWKIITTALNRTAINSQRDLPLVVADLGADDLAALGPKPSASSAALAGHTLSLATFETMAERKARVSGELQSAQAARPTFADSYRRSHGVGKVFAAPKA